MARMYGMDFPEGVSELDIELWCYRHDEREENTGGRLTRWDHFRNAVDLLWNVEGSSKQVVWNEWTERMLKAMIYNKFIGLAGSGSCVHGDTVLFNPLTGRGSTIKEYCERGEKPVVMTLHGPRVADVPYLKDKEELYEVILSNGNRFRCAEDHRVLTEEGWKFIGELSQGSLVFGYERCDGLSLEEQPFLLQTNLGSDPLDQQQDVHRCSERVEDSRCDCHPSLRLCGESLPLAVECARDILLSPDDVQRCNGYVFAHLDDLSDGLEYSHLCPRCGLSMRSDECLQDRTAIPLLRHYDGGTSSLHSPWFQRFGQSLREVLRLRTFSELALCFSRKRNRDYGCVLREESLDHELLGHGSQSSLSPQLCQLQGECSLVEGRGQQSERPSRHSSSHVSCISSALRVSLTTVLSIEKCGEHDFYDLNVPVEHHYFAEGVIHHNSGKSESAGIFAIVDWLSAPADTIFLVCSTTLAGARGRIWKSISALWGALEARWEKEGLTLPGKMVQSKGRIVGMDANGKYSESIGLWLIAAGKDDEAEADKKLKGLKAPDNGCMRLIADEFSDLGMCVFTAMVGNLSSTPGFKGIGMANPGSRHTPFARFVEPKTGWKSLAVGTQQWESKYGVCLSFDAHYSPRILTPELERISEDGESYHLLYNWMPSASYIERAKTAFGEDSVEYWAQIRGMFCPSGMERTVWSETELLDAMVPVEEHEWDIDTPRVMTLCLDPAFVTDGDRSPLVWAECGKIKGKKVMNFLGYKIVAEAGGESQNSEGELIPTTVSENVINQFREHAQYIGARTRHCGFDATGGGVVFGQWLNTKWSHAVKGIRFGEAPIDRRIDSSQPFTVYNNRVTQLWVQAKALVREGQIRGLPREIAEEMCKRKWHPRKHTGKTTCIEEKKEMKARTGQSPDLADTAFMNIEVAIQEGLLDFVEITKVDRKMHRQWKDAVHNQLGMAPEKRRQIVISPTVKNFSYKR